MNGPTEYVIPLPADEFRGPFPARAFAFSGPFPLTPEDWQYVVDVLAVLRPGLVITTQPEEKSQ